MLLPRLPLRARPFIVWPALTFVAALWACSSSSGDSDCCPATQATAPPGDVFPYGVVVGGTCPQDANLYVRGTSGYAMCESGYWFYTAQNPMEDGYVLWAGPDEIALGYPCDGRVYTPNPGDAGGYAFCEDGAWTFTPSNPSTDGYTLWAPDGGS